MVTRTITSKRHGDSYTLKLDDDDAEKFDSRPWYPSITNGRLQFTTNVKGNDGKWRSLLLHRFIMPHCPDLVDHRDHDALDVRKNELRCASKADNNRNRRKTNGPHPKGVTLNKRKSGKYQARISFDDKSIHLGLFPVTPEGAIEAARAYDRKAIELHGQFAKTNYPLSDYIVAAE